MPTARYDIAGDGPLRSALETVAASLGVGEHVKFHGALPGERVRELMDAAHLFVMTSVNIEGDQEGQGLALQEAQAAGLPVIATRHGALPEGLVPDESGLLVPERDVAALLESLYELATHPERWPQMGRTGRRFVEQRYDARQLNQQLVEFYSRLIRGFGHQNGHQTS
jgi:colanic acid/amylovoran biosynthesis glycosyltransferase